MKKIGMTAVVVACASVVVAETVTSANIVGYSKAENVGLEMGTAQFYVGEGNTTTEVFGDSLPVGSKVYKFDPASGYAGNISTYASVFLAGAAWSVEMDLSPGVSYWVETPEASPSVLSGEVPLDASMTNSIVAGMQMLAYPYPVKVAISEMELTPALGDKIYKYDPVTGYAGQIASYASIFFGGEGWNIDLTFEVGEGFWYESVSEETIQWVVNRPFEL